VLARYAGYKQNVAALKVLTDAVAASGLRIPLPAQAALVTLTGAAVGLLLAWRVSRIPVVRDDSGKMLDLEYTMFIPMIVLFSPVAWEHHLTLLILPVFVLGRRLLQNGTSWRTTAAFAALIGVLCVPAHGYVIFPALLLLWGWLIVEHSRATGLRPPMFTRASDPAFAIPSGA